MKKIKQTESEELSTPLSMKDALDSFKTFKKGSEKSKKKSLKDLIWDYPVFLSKLFKRTLPFSYIFTFTIIGLLFALILKSNTLENIFAETVAKKSYVEGTVGAISSFNPLFVSSNYVDKTVESLVFDKFVYIDSNGNPQKGIAKAWSASTNKLEYVFDIDNTFKWQDGEKLTVDDILFTFQTAIALAKDSDSVGVALVGVKIEKVDDTRVRFLLAEPNPTFFEAVSIFIVPKHRLETVNLSDIVFDIFARYPVGSGKYKVLKTEQNVVYLVDNEGDQYSPAIKEITLRVYPDSKSMETAFRVGVLDAIWSGDLKSLEYANEYPSYELVSRPEYYKNRLIFLNVRKDLLKDSKMRIVLNSIVDREKLLSMSGISGVVMNGLYPARSWAFDASVHNYVFDAQKASALLQELGYVKNTSSGLYESKDGKILSFTISYLSNDLNNRMVKALKDIFLESGIILIAEPLNYTQITQEIIATRDFELLLYEVETTVDPDQYNLWHSLKVNYPDLNLSGYEYERVDILLEDARKTSSVKDRKEKYSLFQKYLMAGSPAVFLYNPSYSFYVNKDLKGYDWSKANFAYERFTDIQDWYWSK